MRQVTADLDNDGIPEQVAAYQDGEQVTITITSQNAGRPWQIALPAGATLTDLYVRDVNADALLEVLIESSAPDGDWFSLHVVHWADGHGRLLVPSGGPLAGGDCFRSLHYPPWLDDLMGDTTYEIIISADGTDARFLDSVVYEWNGHTYSTTELYVVPPRLRPTATPVS